MVPIRSLSMSSSFWQFWADLREPYVCDGDRSDRVNTHRVLLRNSGESSVNSVQADSLCHLLHDPRM